MHVDDDLWFETCKRLRDRVSPRPATDPPPVTFTGDDADDLSWVLAEAMTLPAVRAELRQVKATLEAALAAFDAAKASGKDPAAAACRALGKIRDEVGKNGRKKRGRSYNNQAILSDWQSLREEPKSRIAEIIRRHHFPNAPACIKHLRRIRDEIEAAYGKEVACAVLDNIPGDPTGI